MMDAWLVNDIATDTVPVTDRGLAYGDGLFETIAVREGACRFIDDHLARLAAGCRQLGIDYCGDASLIANIDELLRQHNTSHGVIKIIITRGSGPRGYAYKREDTQPARIVGIAATQPAARPVHGVRIIYCKTPVSRNRRLAGIKSLNRLPQVLGRAEWDDADIAEGLMADDRDNLICGTMSNLFMVREHELWTPPITECGVAGIMRERTIRAAEQANIRINQAYFSAADLAIADEVFLTNSLIGIWPVAQLGDRKLPPGPITHQLLQALAAQGVNECQR